VDENKTPMKVTLDIWFLYRRGDSDVLSMTFANEAQAAEYVQRAVQNSGMWTDDGTQFIPWHCIDGINKRGA